jgi:hypothetical protein
MQDELDALLLENQEMQNETDRTEEELGRCIDVINYAKVSLKYKIDELKMIEECIDLHGQKQPDISDLDVDLSMQEEHFRNLQQKISLSMNSVINSNSCKI